MSPPIMLTIKELAKKCKGCGITEFRIREMAKSGEIPCIRAGRKILINEEAFYEYLKAPCRLTEQQTVQGIERVEERA